MAASLPASNVYQAVAQQITTAATRTLPERIFQNALDEILKKEAKKKTEVLKRLVAIQDEQAMKQQFDDEFQKSRFFGEDAGERTSRKVARIADHIHNAKPYLDKFMQINQGLMMPIWGTIMFVIMVVRNIPALDSLLAEFDKQVKVHLSTFKEHFMKHETLSTALRDSLQAFYSCIIMYSVRVSPLLKASPIRVYLKAYTGEAKSGLETLLGNLKEAAQQVYNAGSAQTHSGVNDLLRAKLESNDNLQSPSSTAAAPRRIENVPRALTLNFTGQEQTLRSMKDLLGTWGLQRPREVSLWGLPGAGKSQTSLRLMNHSRTEDGVHAMYQHKIFIRAHSKDVVESEIRRVVINIRPGESFLYTLHISLITQIFLRWLDKNERWILVFDDVQDANHIHAFRPPQGQGHVIYNTRSKLTATRLCDATRAIEMRPMNESDGMKLVEAIMGSDFHEGIRDNARAVANFCRGLPLAIETLVHYALANKLSLMQTLANMSNKEQLLKQNHSNSFHEDNASVGAVLVTTFEEMRKKHPGAGVLFILLTYLEPSSIPMSLIPKEDKVEEYFARIDTYDRGCIRTPEGENKRKKMSGHQKFDLLDYDPFKLELWQRIFHLAEFKKKFWEPDLPRIDSASDIALEQYWRKSDMLRRMLSSRIERDEALRQLEDSGLVRRIPGLIDTYWIHDLFAELTTAFIASESKQMNQNAAHLASTMVFLSLPIPEARYKTRELCFAGLPHAQSCLRHLKESGIFSDATIGAELAHVAASTIDLRMRSFDERAHGMANVVEYYRMAYEGYLAASGRLMRDTALKKKKGNLTEKILIATVTDQIREVACQVVGRGMRPWHPQRYLDEYERVGSSAPWRCLNTMFRLAASLAEQGNHDEGVLLVGRAMTGIEAFFGRDHQETSEVRDYVMDFYAQAKKWEKVLEICEAQASTFGRQSTLDWRVTIGGADVMKRMGLACQELGRWHEALVWFEMTYETRAKFYGKDSKLVLGNVMNLARCYAKQEVWDKELWWWSHGFDLIFGAVDTEVDESGFKKDASVGKDVVEACIEEFEEAKGKWEESLRERGEEGAQIVKISVRSIDRAIMVWRSSEEDRKQVKEDSLRKWRELEPMMNDEMKERLREGKRRGWDWGFE